MNQTIDRLWRTARGTRLLLAAELLGAVAAPAAFAVRPYDVLLWPGGVVTYRFAADHALSVGDRAQLRNMMQVWVDALTIADPADPQQTRQYARFVECTNHCPANYVSVRYNLPEENGNMCSYDRTHPPEKVGLNPHGVTILHFQGHQPDPVVLHEVGHCLGMWHEQNRVDRDRWLDEADGYCDLYPDQCTGGFPADTQAETLAPLLGNYDYDSIMHYPSYTAAGVLRWRDRLGNAFLGETWIAPARPARVSAKDISRVLQLYTRERHPSWGFFTSLSQPPPPEVGVDSADFLPIPYLQNSGLIAARGTPALAAQGSGSADLFARGSDGKIYWQALRGVVHSSWRSIGCCFASDPSAVSRRVGRLDVVAVNTAGEVQRLKYIDGVWAAPLTIRGGAPSGGLRRAADRSFIGPAIASRNADSLDVFVVRADGRLAVSSWEAGNWSAWRTLGSGYVVAARPAAVAMGTSSVQVAINEGGEDLYLPLVAGLPGSPRLTLGERQAEMATGTAPALARRSNGLRVFMVTAARRVAEWHTGSDWQDIGGIPAAGTGLSAVARGSYGWSLTMNGETARGCSAFCLATDAPHAGEAIQPGGLWLRDAD